MQGLKQKIIIDNHGFFKRHGNYKYLYNISIYTTYTAFYRIGTYVFASDKLIQLFLLWEKEKLITLRNNHLIRLLEQTLVIINLYT